MKPNIFTISTKELSQDAFITWLLQWADRENEQYDKDLHLCGLDFITRLIKRKFPNAVPDVKKVVTGRQWENIDIWAEVTDSNCNYLIIIEDKTFTGERSDQLSVYKKTAEDWCANNNSESICIYLKTGSEPEFSLRKIQEKGYGVFSRQDFLNLLDKYERITNDIFCDFRDRLKFLETSYSSFENKSIDDWDDLCWVGFYQVLEKEIDGLNWDAVNNPSGGFWCAVFPWEYWDGYPVYIQIEQGSLCFKICTDAEEVDLDENFDRRKIREEWSAIVLANAKLLQLKEVRRPDRFGYGKYMTVAVVDRDNWLGAGELKMDRKVVVERLNRYRDLLTKCLSN